MNEVIDLRTNEKYEMTSEVDEDNPSWIIYKKKWN